MVHRSGVFYTLLLSLVAILVTAGCGKPASPPPGAPPSADAPTIEQGTPSGPQDSSAGPALSDPGSGSPPAEQGEKK